MHHWGVWEDMHIKNLYVACICMLDKTVAVTFTECPVENVCVIAI